MIPAGRDSLCRKRGGVSEGGASSRLGNEAACSAQACFGQRKQRLEVATGGFTALEFYEEQCGVYRRDLIGKRMNGGARPEALGLPPHVAKVSVEQLSTVRELRRKHGGLSRLAVSSGNTTCGGRGYLIFVAGGTLDALLRSIQG